MQPITVCVNDVLLHAGSAEEMLDILELFLHTVVCHNMAIHPAKCELFGYIVGSKSRVKELQWTQSVQQG